MDNSLLKQYLKGRYIQTSVVILLGFGSLWFKFLESTALVTIIAIALSVDAVAEHMDNRLQKETP